MNLDSNLSADQLFSLDNFSKSPLTPTSSVELLVWRHPLYLTVVYFMAYNLVLATGLVGNLFVLIAVVSNPRMRVTTNFFISSLALADLLIIIFCVPATLMNNILYEWYLGNFLCKMSVWINATTVCASVYTLVAVSTDRYFAICHPLRYGTVEPISTLLVIVPIWLISGALFSPYYIFFYEKSFPYRDTHLLVCVSKFPSVQVSQYFFIVANFFVAFLLPLGAILLCYAYIYCAVVRRSVVAVDRNAHKRERTVKIKVTHMMVTVVVLFAASWLPFYSFFAYVLYNEEKMAHTGMQIMRAVFQWLSLANSCINPILYAYFSRRFRRAFREILILPCREHYRTIRNSRIEFRKKKAEQVKKRIIDLGMHETLENTSSSFGRKLSQENTTGSQWGVLKVQGGSRAPASFSSHVTKKVFKRRDANFNVEHLTASLSSACLPNEIESCLPPFGSKLLGTKRLSLFSGLYKTKKWRQTSTGSRDSAEFDLKPLPLDAGPSKNFELTSSSDSSSSEIPKEARGGMAAMSLMTLPCLLLSRSNLGFTQISCGDRQLSEKMENQEKDTVSK